MKRLLIIAVFLILGATIVGFSEPPSAEAGMKKWFWTERKAETRLTQRYSDVRSAECIGFGHNWRYNQYGQEVFTAFYCSGGLTDGSDYQITMYTTGKNRFKWFPF